MASPVARVAEVSASEVRNENANYSRWKQRESSRPESCTCHSASATVDWYYVRRFDLHGFLPTPTDAYSC